MSRKSEVRVLERPPREALRAGDFFSEPAPISEPLLPSRSPPRAPEGRVHSMDSMTAVDGHGLRLIVFLQGCSKRCVFCCNPDSWSPSAGRWVTVGDVRRALAKNLAYYRRSGGGVTLSGGECLLQPEFCRAVCVMAHRLGVTAAIDTAAAGVETQWRRLLPEVDVALVCVKSADPEKHARITQAHDQRPHRVLMAFLRACEDHGVKVWIRHVLMEARVEEGVEEEDERAREGTRRSVGSGTNRDEPEPESESADEEGTRSRRVETRLDVFRRLATDGDEDVDGVARVVHAHANIAGVELLPYHRFGEYKWREMGLAYPLRGMKTPSKETIERVKARFEARGVTVIL